MPTSVFRFVQSKPIYSPSANQQLCKFIEGIIRRHILTYSCDTNKVQNPCANLSDIKTCSSHKRLPTGHVYPIYDSPCQTPRWRVLQNKLKQAVEDWFNSPCEALLTLSKEGYSFKLKTTVRIFSKSTDDDSLYRFSVEVALLPDSLKHRCIQKFAQLITHYHLNELRIPEKVKDQISEYIHLTSSQTCDIRPKLETFHQQHGCRGIQS